MRYRPPDDTKLKKEFYHWLVLQFTSNKKDGYTVAFDFEKKSDKFEKARSNGCKVYGAINSSWGGFPFLNAFNTIV